VQEQRVLSKAFRKACKRLGLKHIRTRAYTPKTNGKAERFIQTALREWAYVQAYPTSDHRADQLGRIAAGRKRRRAIPRL
jgi:transposase InsO family protein